MNQRYTMKIPIKHYKIYNLWKYLLYLSHNKLPIDRYMMFVNTGKFILKIFSSIAMANQPLHLSHFPVRDLSIDPAN